MQNEGSHCYQFFGHLMHGWLEVIVLFIFTSTTIIDEYYPCCDMDQKSVVWIVVDGNDQYSLIKTKWRETSCSSLDDLAVGRFDCSGQSVNDSLSHSGPFHHNLWCRSLYEKRPWQAQSVGLSAPLTWFHRWGAMRSMIITLCYQHRFEMFGIPYQPM